MQKQLPIQSPLNHTFEVQNRFFGNVCYPKTKRNRLARRIKQPISLARALQLSRSKFFELFRKTTNTKEQVAHTQPLENYTRQPCRTVYLILKLNCTLFFFALGYRTDCLRSIRRVPRSKFVIFSTKDFADKPLRLRSPKRVEFVEPLETQKKSSKTKTTKQKSTSTVSRKRCEKFFISNRVPRRVHVTGTISVKLARFRASRPQKSQCFGAHRVNRNQRYSDDIEFNEIVRGALIMHSAESTIPFSIFAFRVFRTRLRACFIPFRRVLRGTDE